MGGSEALAGRPDQHFQYHHQAFVYFKAYADGEPAKTEHLRDESEFLGRARSAELPAVSFVKPLGSFTAHPGYDLMASERHTVELIDAVRKKPNWRDTAIIVTYDGTAATWTASRAAGRRPMGTGSPGAHDHHLAV